MAEKFYGNPENGLPPGAIVYGIADIPHIKTAIEDVYPDLLNNRNVARFVDSTDSAVFGIYRDLADDEQSYFLVTRGTYPDSIYKFLFFID